MQNFKVTFLCILLWLFASTALADTTQLTSLKVVNDDNKVQIVLNLSGTVTYKVFTLSNPHRVVVDLEDTKLATALRDVNISKTPIVKIREGHPKPNTLRIVFEVTQLQHPKAIANTDNPASGQRLVIDLSDATANQTTAATEQKPLEPNTQPSLAPTQASHDNNPQSVEQDLNAAINSTVLAKNDTPTKTDTAKPTSEVKTITPAADKPAETNLTPQIVAPTSGHRSIIIVIDPGHGGKDPGTIGGMGIKEKNVVLAISLKLQQILNQESGFKAVLTRNSDYFIPLRQRLAIARKDEGDIFVAIHADAYINPYAGGSSVFALSAHGASSEAARWLAEKENYSELGGVSLSDKNNVLRSVLIDLSQTATIASSLQIGSSILRQLGRVGKLHRGFVEQAPFMVLKNPDIPSLLVETGFLSNPLEEQRLNDPAYQQQMANAIAAGIKSYFYNNPPPGTMVAASKNKKFS